MSNLKRHDETIAPALLYMERHGEDLTMLDVVKVALYYTGKISEAIRFGQRALDLHDAEAAAMHRWSF
ncbi:hypothetical protein [Bradyrhizobium archetypum]|uniref:Uncharacterized protein n=1 Tax=Bradyrhizobium archetypum TaxID=2721160 RepID=A0A7Y4M136_9BRAD|nr:hypothetical protein [Bradyrhizobium archetypum]NOJ46021.1 hypothetical protein [Bradyrhizobium archetypum]